MQLRITDDLGALLATLPPNLRAALEESEELSDLLEVVLDLGRLPSARFPGHEIRLGTEEVSHADLEYVVARIGHFGDDPRGRQIGHACVPAKCQGSRVRRILSVGACQQEEGISKHYVHGRCFGRPCR